METTLKSARAQAMRDMAHQINRAHTTEQRPHPFTDGAWVLTCISWHLERGTKRTMKQLRSAAECAIGAWC